MLEATESVVAVTVPSIFSSPSTSRYFASAARIANGAGETRIRGLISSPPPGVTPSQNVVLSLWSDRFISALATKNPSPSVLIVTELFWATAFESVSPRYTFMTAWTLLFVWAFPSASIHLPSNVRVSADAAPVAVKRNIKIFFIPVSFPPHSPSL